MGLGLVGVIFQFGFVGLNAGGFESFGFFVRVGELFVFLLYNLALFFVEGTFVRFFYCIFKDFNDRLT